MSGTAHRLARRYLPLRARRVVVALRDAARADSVSGPGAVKAKTSAGKGASGKSRARGAEARPPKLIESLRNGNRLVDSLVAETRALLEADEPHKAASIGASLAKEPETAVIGRLISALVAYHRGYLAFAWHEFEAVPPDLRWRHAPAEYARSGIGTNRAEVLDEIRRLVAEAPEYMDAKAWIDVLGAAFGAGDEDLSREVFGVLDRIIGAGEGVDQGLVVERDWMRPWVAASGDSPDAEAVRPDHVSIGIMAYGHPGRHRASANIGDHVQSLASLGHLVRHQDVRFHGPQDLVDLVEHLQGRVRPEMARTGATTDVDVITVDRDASIYKPVPPNTWTLAFGWFMHAIFEQRYGFPLHHNVLPIFVSFHCNKRDLLTPEALEYLRRYGPIGCRDWTTVDILLSVDVPAFFSGCVTTTTNTVFPDLAEEPSPDAPVAYVDMPEGSVPPGAVTYRHSSDRVRFRSFATSVFDALDLLETYRGKHPSLVTSRLHAWLPARSLGVPVEFVPKNRSDIRFAGLIDITSAQFDLIRDGINDKLEQVMSAILSGQEPEQVYELWRSLTADDVEAARQRRENTRVVQGPAKANLESDLSRAVSSTVTRPASGGSPSAIHIAVHLSPDKVKALPAFLGSLTRHTSRGLHVWIVTRESESVDVAELGKLFPSLTLSMVPTRGLGARVHREGGRPVVARDMDLLVLAELLPDVERVVLLPIDAVVTGDVAELFDLDLGGHLFAAPSVEGAKGTSGFGVIHTAAMRLGTKTAAATELRRRAYAKHAFDFDAFSTAVMVFDLARLRSERFAAEHLAYVEECGLGYREILHFAAGPDRAVVPTEWDCVPTRTVVGRPGLIHWADPVKPWSAGYTTEQERWHEAFSLSQGHAESTP